MCRLASCIPDKFTMFDVCVKIMLELGATVLYFFVARKVQPRQQSNLQDKDKAVVSSSGTLVIERSRLAYGRSLHV